MSGVGGSGYSTEPGAYTTDDGGCTDLGCGCDEPAPSGCDNACGSTLENDECGVCGGDNSSCADCAGTPNGDAWESDCGCVAADNSGDDCDDCLGTPNGSAVVDICGVCCLLYTSPSPRDGLLSRMPSSA